MKKVLKSVAVLLCTTILFSSCLGSFSLTSKVLKWNKGLGDKWVNELVFAALNVIPVYSISLFIDGVVLNSIEFWTGEKMISGVGESKIVKNAAGEDIQIVRTENGYDLSNGNSQMSLVFDEADNSWSAVCGENTAKLVKFIDENNAELYTLNGNVMNVTLDAAGIDAARQAVNFAMSR